MRIAICEDEEAQAQYLASLARRWAAGRGQALQVDCYPTAESFWFVRHGDAGADLLLLDIQLPGESGLDLARRLRGEGETLPIAFITGLDEHLGEGYELEALHYLVKPVSEERFFALLDRAARRLPEPTLVIRAEGEERRLLQREILCAQAGDRQTLLHTLRGDFALPLSLEKVEKALSPDLFFRCHRSCLVSLRAIARLGREELVLDDGTRLPVSRRMGPQLGRAFARCNGGMLL